MGATLTEQRAEGRTVGEAYDAAIREATSYYGTQDGYSGAINSKDRGFYLVTLPPRLSYRKFSDVLFDYGEAVEEIEDARWDRERARTKAERSKVETRVRRARTKRDRLDAKYPTLDLARIYDIHNSKWGVPLAIELRPSEAKASRRGHRVYVFTGYAPS